MRKFVLPLLASLLSVSAAQTADYKLDPTHTKAVFYIDHFNTSTNSGGFYEINGDISFDPETMDGNLTMKGKTQPIQLTATKFGCYQSPIFKAEVCGGDFEATIDRTQWGVDFLVKEGMAKMVKLEIQAEAIKQ